MHRPRSSIVRLPKHPPAPTPSDPITFEERCGIVVAKLGCVIVGMVHQPATPGGRPWWVCALPDTPTRPEYVPSVDVAKDRLAERISDWIEAAGLHA